jgi:hypothetical protein
MSVHPVATFRISPVIRLTLLLLYIALTLPLPFLAQLTQAPISANLLWIGIGGGSILLLGALGEQVKLYDDRLCVVYPRWFPGFLRQGWSLPWDEIADLKLRTTGQGGLVYYFVTPAADRAYLLPMRVAGFSRFVTIVSEKTGIDTTEIRPLSQPWMYLILLVFTVFLLAIDAWAIWTATTQI